MMKDIREFDSATTREVVIKKVRLHAPKSGWGNGPHFTYLMVKIDHERHQLSFMVSGCDPDINVLSNFMMFDKDIYQEVCWYHTSGAWSRRNPAYVRRDAGQSARYLELWTDVQRFDRSGDYQPPDWASDYVQHPTKKHDWKISCFDKIEGLVGDYWIPDLIDLLSAYGTRWGLSEVPITSEYIKYLRPKRWRWPTGDEMFICQYSSEENKQFLLRKSRKEKYR